MVRPSSESFQIRYFFIGLFLICISAYFNSLFCDFVYDDKYLIINNPYIKNLSFITRTFSTCLYDVTSEFARPNYYRPLQTISFMVDYRLWRFNPFGYHLTNIFLHFLNCLLVYGIIYILFENLFIAAASSLFFCVHPINITAVTYISGRADLLVALFMLGAFFCAALSFKYRKRYTTCFLLSILFFVSALFSRENALFIPLGMLLLFFYIKGEKKYKIILLASSVFIIVFYLLFRVRLLNMPIAQYPLMQLSPFLKFINSAYIFISYISLLILPRDLHLMHTLPPIISLGDARAWIILVSFSILLIFFYAKKDDKIILFSIIWFFIFVLQSFFLMTKFARNQLSIREHWIYIASLGFYVLVSYLLYNLKKYLKIYIYPCIAIILSIYASIVITSNLNFKNDLVLSQYLLRLEPKNSEIHAILAEAYLEKREYAKATWHIEKFCEEKPDNPGLYMLQGVYYEDIGNIESAMLSYEKLLKIIPNSGRAYNNLGAIYFNLGDYDKAEKFFAKAINYSPFLYEPYLNMAKLYDKDNDVNNAVSFYRKAIQSNPDSQEAFIRLAQLYMKNKYFKEALDVLNKASSAGHRECAILVMLGITNDELEFKTKALLYFKEALNMEPKSVEALCSLGVFYANHNQLDRAIESWERALEISPGNEAINANIKKLEELQER